MYQEALVSLLNFNKSHIYSWNYSPRDLIDISKILGIKGTFQWFNFKYLGIPIFKTTLKASSWLLLINKIKNRINTWGATWLNPIGKVILIKSVLSTIPIYQSSILLAPKGILNKIESLLKKFLWKGGKQNENKLHLVN